MLSFLLCSFDRFTIFCNANLCSVCSAVDTLICHLQCFPLALWFCTEFALVLALVTWFGNDLTLVTLCGTLVTWFGNDLTLVTRCGTLVTWFGNGLTLVTRCGSFVLGLASLSFAFALELASNLAMSCFGCSSYLMVSMGKSRLCNNDGHICCLEPCSCCDTGFSCCNHGVFLLGVLLLGGFLLGGILIGGCRLCGCAPWLLFKRPDKKRIDWHWFAPWFLFGFASWFLFKWLGNLYIDFQGSLPRSMHLGLHHGRTGEHIIQLRLDTLHIANRVGLDLGKHLAVRSNLWRLWRMPWWEYSIKRRSQAIEIIHLILLSWNGINNQGSLTSLRPRWNRMQCAKVLLDGASDIWINLVISNILEQWDDAIWVGSTNFRQDSANTFCIFPKFSEVWKQTANIVAQLCSKQPWCVVRCIAKQAGLLLMHSQKTSNDFRMCKHTVRVNLDDFNDQIIVQTKHVAFGCHLPTKVFQRCEVTSDVPSAHLLHDLSKHLFQLSNRNIRIHSNPRCWCQTNKAHFRWIMQPRCGARTNRT